MSEKKLKNLPLGEQNFKKIIEKNLLYVDKTDEIYKLLSTGGTYFFYQDQEDLENHYLFQHLNLFF